MPTIEEQQKNPLHGLKLDVLLNELVDHYGWEILADAINVNCFKQKPTIAASLKFLRKTQWAQEKLEAFYLYQFKSLPKPSDAEYELPPRQRTITHEPWEPAVLTVGQFQAKRDRKAQNPRSDQGRKGSAYSSKTKSYDSQAKKQHQKSNTEPQKNSDGFINPWTDEHY